MKFARIEFAILLTALFWAAGCATQGHDPLEGRKDLRTVDIVKGCPFGQTIKNDYQNYIQKLPLDERCSVEDIDIHFYEGVNGQRAVKITTYTKGFIGEILWERILIYNASDQRIKAIKHKKGRFLADCCHDDVV